MKREREREKNCQVFIFMIIINILLFCCVCHCSDQDSAELNSDSDSELEDIGLEEPSTPNQELVEQFFASRAGKNSRCACLPHCPCDMVVRMCTGSV